MRHTSFRGAWLVAAVTLVTGCFLASGSSALGDIVIDDFEEGPLYFPDPTPSSGTEYLSQTLSPAHVAMGVRRLENYGTRVPSILELTLTGGGDAIHMTSNSTAYFNFIYNGPTGYLNLDLSGADRFELTFPRLDAGISLIMTLQSGNSFPQVVLYVAQPGVLVVPFSSFGSPNWADIDLVRLEFNTKRIPGGATHVESLSDFRAVPEPATMSLFAMGLGALAIRRRRRA